MSATDRAVLDVDGNCAYALVGPNIQEGEVEFVEIGPARNEPDGAHHAAMLAATKALHALESRLDRRLTYELRGVLARG